MQNNKNEEIIIKLLEIRMNVLQKELDILNLLSE